MKFFPRSDLFAHIRKQNRNVEVSGLECKQEIILNYGKLADIF